MKGLYRINYYQVGLQFTEGPVRLGDTAVADDGSYRLAVTIPKNTVLGDQVIQSFEFSEGFGNPGPTFAITVTAAAIVPTGDLVVTGLDGDAVVGGLWSALVLLLGGAALVIGARRRTARTE